MALQATVHNVEIAVSDVDRGVYETLDLRVAQHPSETMRYLVAGSRDNPVKTDETLLIDTLSRLPQLRGPQTVLY